MPVLPLVASITVWPGFSSPDCSAASITPSASRSLTEPNGLKPSIFTNRFTPGGPSLLIFTTGVLPTVSRILSYRATLLLPSRHSQSFDQRRRSCATHGFPSEPAAPVPGDCSSVRGPESRPTCARNSCQKATLRNLQHPMAGALGHSSRDWVPLCRRDAPNTFRPPQPGSPCSLALHRTG